MLTGGDGRLGQPVAPPRDAAATVRLAKRVHTDTRRGAEKVGARGRTHRYETLPRMGTAVVRSLGCMKPVSPVSTVGALLPSSQIYYPAAY